MDEEEEENIDMTKRIQDITNNEQKNPTEVYKGDQVVNGNAKIVPSALEQDGDEEMVEENYDMLNVDLNFYDPNEK